MENNQAPSLNKFQEITEEFRSVMSGRGGWADALIPPLAFILLNGLTGIEISLGVALGAAIVTGIYRILKKQQTRYALGGIAGVLLAMTAVYLVDGAQGYFLPGIVTGIFTAIICFLSVLFKRPLVAFTSFLTRRWPLAWYWHPQVRPAYSEVTLVWGLFFALRTMLQYSLFLRNETTTLGLAQLLLGWPALILLLAASYLYGLWRLGKLKGPSVEELKSGTAPPWKGQKRGF